MSVAALRRHVGVLAGEIGERNVGRPAKLAAAERYIAREWAGEGHEVAAQRYVAAGVDCANLEIVIPGATLPGEIIVVGAHYDTVEGSPGADDNASAVAALLEIARALAGSRPARSLKLVAFVNEEAPFYFGESMGSGVYARAARRRGDDVRAMFSLEMLGCYSDAPCSQSYPPLLKYFYPSRGNFIAFVSNLRSHRVLRAAVAAFRASTRFPCEHAALPSWVPGVGWSDQLSFWRAGYRAIMVTDTAFHRYAHYHRPTDTPDRLDYDRLAEVTRGLAGAFGRLASGPLP